MRTSVKNNRAAFTIVELLIVIVVIAILAVIATVSYNGVSQRARVSAAKNVLSQLATKNETYKVQNSDNYASNSLDLGVRDATITYVGGGTSYCASTTAESVTYYISSTQTSPVEGICPPTPGNFIQTVTSATCPTSVTLSVDARDNHTYWIKKLADGKCWMLTNLAYGGGGTNTYSDTKNLTNSTSGGTETYTVASYYIPTGSNVTTYPTAPSTATNGTGQYGYLYNWCGAMGNQQSTGACTHAATPAANTAISVCPAGWRLPTGNGGEFAALNTAINSGRSSTDAGFRSTWLSQYSGDWDVGFLDQGSEGIYWSSSQFNLSSAYLWYLDSGDSYSASDNKVDGFAVRCLAI